LNTSENNVPQDAQTAKQGLMSVVQARKAMLAAIRPLQSERVALHDALGRVLVEPVIASRDQPPFAVSSMDGYAVRSADTPGNLRVIGESSAGKGFTDDCGPATAIRISTGAALPKGADAIVIQEDVTRSGDQVAVPDTPADAFVRRRGGDFTAGHVLLRAGRRLDGVALALVAASGAASVTVARVPRIAILSSGDELAAPGSVPGPYQVYDSATFGVAGLVRSWGGLPQCLAIARDDVTSVSIAASQGLRDSDLLVVVGGASVGDHDHARPALEQLGLQLAVGKVAVRPGKPTWFGVTPQGPALGLPGNPASAVVCSFLFLRPLIAAMQGCDSGTVIHRARLAVALPANGSREHYLRSRLDADSEGQLRVRAFEDQDSSLLSVFAAANALIRLPPEQTALEAGTVVDVLLLDRA
jgi:molybdopterin molybdotransferase